MLGRTRHVAHAQIIFGQRMAQQFLFAGITARCYRIHKRLQKLDRTTRIVIAVGKNALVELRLLGSHLAELAFNAQKLMVRQQCFETSLIVQSTGNAGVNLLGLALILL